MTIKKKNISIIGLGYVGLPLAVEFGKIRPTLGYDLNEERINQLKKGIDETLELTKEELANSENLKFTSDANDLRDTDIFIITVPTPIDDAKRPNLTSVIKASEMVANFIGVGSIVVYESTVYPGCTEEVCVPILEKVSGLTFNKDFFCGYSPERINPGDKINTLTKIKKITSGSTDQTALEIDDLYKSIISAGTFKATSIKVAEAAKVIENTQRDLNIALVNELSLIFERLEIDTLDVLEAAGSKWNFLPFRPGLVGGHCIGVDPYYLTHKSEQVGYNPQVILAGRRINDNMAYYTAQKVVQKMINNGIDISKSTVGIMGITFKENCPDIRNSKIFDLIDELKNWGLKLIIDDQWANTEEVKRTHNLNIEEINTNNKVDSLIVAVGHKEFRALSPEILRSYCDGDAPVLADIKSIFDKRALCDQGLSVFRL